MSADVMDLLSFYVESKIDISSSISLDIYVSDI